MIAGVAACALIARPMFDPGGPLLQADFVAGVYSVNGVTAAAADVIDHPEWIGGGGEGLQISYGNESEQGAGVAHFIGDALTVLLGLEWTLVIEWDEKWDDDTTTLLSLLDGDLDTYSQQIEITREDAEDSLMCAISDLGSGSRGATTFPEGADIGVHRLAVTRTASRLAISLDGGDVHATETDNTVAGLTNATIGAMDGAYLINDLNFRSITVYPPQADLDLPTLSA